MNDFDIMNKKMNEISQARAKKIDDIIYDYFIKPKAIYLIKDEE